MLTMGNQRETSIEVNFINTLAKYANDGESERNINRSKLY